MISMKKMTPTVYISVGNEQSQPWWVTFNGSYSDADDSVHLKKPSQKGEGRRQCRQGSKGGRRRKQIGMFWF